MMGRPIDCCGSPAFCEREDCSDFQEYQREQDGLELGRTLVELVPLTAPGHLAVAEHNQRLIDATSVDNECAHGSLPGDPIQRCRCWGAVEERAA